MGKWTRRAFITTGVVAGGGFAIGVARVSGHRAPELASLVTEEGESLVNVWVKLDQKQCHYGHRAALEMGSGCTNRISANARRRNGCGLGSGAV